MIVAIDGPAGAGKSTVARKLADRLGFQFLDTGAMYRAVTWAALDRGVDLGDEHALVRLAASLRITFADDRVWVDGIDVSREIRSRAVTENVGLIADAVPVRDQLVQLQRDIASQGQFVCEGRDQGTVVFPDSPCKIFLTATARQRAIRRVQQLEAAGEVASVDEMIEQQTRRDLRDRQRPVGGLQQAPDAIEVNTEHLSVEEVVDQLERIAREKLGLASTD